MEEVVPAESNGSLVRHPHLQLHKHYSQFTYRWLIVNRYILCVSSGRRGPPPCCTDIYRGRHTDWVPTLVTT